MRRINWLAAAAIGVVAPVAQAAPAKCVAGPFMVFFDPGSAVLTPQAKAILNNAVDNYAACGGAIAHVMGHTDRRGAAAQNVVLSKRMADSVQRYLIARGMPSKKIDVTAFGESRTLVDTADEVAEPQNRRVEIYYEQPLW